MPIRVVPIDEPAIGSAAQFLHQHLNARVSVNSWAQSMRVPWKIDAPNHGFMLVADNDHVEGVYLAFYSEREIAGQVERFCNLGAWCVLPDRGFHGVRLLRALLAQPDFHFTDLSPSGNVVAINERLGFQFLDTTTALIPNLPWPSFPGRFTVSSSPELIESMLHGADLQLYHDHLGAAAARHLVLAHGDETCYFVFRRDRRKNLPLFASILYVSNPDLFARMSRLVSRHLLLRHGIPITLVEVRVAGRRPRMSTIVSANRRKMFRSAQLEPEQIDNLYSELVCVAW